MRKVRGLKEVREVAPPANRKGGTAFSPSAAEGLRYERQLALHAASLGWRVVHGQWIKFRDSKGIGHCQPDVLCLPPDRNRVVLLEAKLTQNSEGEVKLEKLYVPVVRALYKLPVFPVLCFKNILAERDLMLAQLAEAAALPSRLAGKVHFLHWSAL